MRRKLLVLGSWVEGWRLRMVLWMRAVLKQERQGLQEKKVAIVVFAGSE